MIKHTQSAGCLVAALLAFGLISSCSKAPTSPKEELVEALKGTNVDGYVFASTESSDRTIASFTNKSADGITTLASGDATRPLKYTRIKDNKANATALFKTEVIKKGTALTLAVTDISGNKILDQRTLPAVGRVCEPPAPFDSIGACIENFDCTGRGALQCQANRTCEPQVAALTCCLKNGSIISVHLLINPENRRFCLLQSLYGDIDAIAVSLN